MRQAGIFDYTAAVCVAGIAVLIVWAGLTLSLLTLPIGGMP